jgi:hypothetical protein
MCPVCHIYVGDAIISEHRRNERHIYLCAQQAQLLPTQSQHNVENADMAAADLEENRTDIDDKNIYDDPGVMLHHIHGHDELLPGVNIFRT